LVVEGRENDAERIAALEAENAELRALIDTLRAEVAELKHELSRHSGNSGKPPSSDTLAQRAEQDQQRMSRAERRAAARKMAKELQERAKTKRRPGKQPGEQGRTLERRDDPDEIVTHVPGGCVRCGSDLGDAEVTGVECRQVFDVPRVEVKVTEHRAETRRCRCGAVTAAGFPDVARAAVCYGPFVRALAAYLMARQHLPVARTAELLCDVLGTPVSTGLLAGIVPEAAGGLGGFLARLKAILAAAAVAHADETGARVSGSRYWFHTVATAAFTLVGCHPKRGVDAFVDMGVLPAFSGVLVTDGWSPYWSERIGATFEHALCGSHLIRDLAAVAELGGQDWALKMADVLIDGKQAADAARDRGDKSIPANTLKALRRRYSIVLAQGWAANPDPGRKRTKLERVPVNLLARLEKQRHEVCRSWADLGVAFTNNEAERSLRMLKLHDKISGCFRTLTGAKAFCDLRSYIQSALKNDINVLDALVWLFQGDPWIPALPGP
jgi:transposase